MFRGCGNIASKGKRVQRVLFLLTEIFRYLLKRQTTQNRTVFFLLFSIFYFLLAHSFHFFWLDGALANNFVRVPPKGQAQHIASHRIASHLSEFFVWNRLLAICIKYLFRLRKSSRILSCGFSEPTPVFVGPRKTAGNIEFALITFEQINKFDEKWNTQWRQQMSPPSESKSESESHGKSCAETINCFAKSISAFA